MKTTRRFCLYCCLLAAATFIWGCGSTPENAFDSRIGVVSRDLRLDSSVLTPDSVRLDSKYENFFFNDHLVFLGEKDSLRYALSLTFTRALEDNRYKRAERDFTGFLFDGHKWIVLPYTRMRHDSLRLDLNIPYVFGGLNFTESHSAGTVIYNRHDLRFDLQFDSLQPVQAAQEGMSLRHSHAIGIAKLALPNDTVVGQVSCELVQLEGHSPFANVTRRLTYSDYSWFALTTKSGANLLAAADTAARSQITKSFLALQSDGSVRYADGSDHVRIVPLSGDPSSRSSVRVGIAASELGIEAETVLRDGKRVCQGDLCVGLVEGYLGIEGKRENAWGVLEQRRQAEPQKEN
jgi:hypothetical protein